MIAQETAKDPTLRTVSKYVLNGWPDVYMTNDVKAYKHFADYLNFEEGCLLFGSRVIIPRTLKTSCLKLLHSNHIGITRMKQVSREYVYWLGINRDIENYVVHCEPCQTFMRKKPNKEFGRWPSVSFPFERIHLDFYHFKGRSFLILVDVYTRWIEIREMKKTNCEATIKVLESIFAIFGYARNIVADNGPPFNSYDFKKYVESTGATLINSPPYHPESNGSAEKAVDTAKSALRKFCMEASSSSSFQMTDAIVKFLRNYRNQPHTQDQIIPAERIFSYRPIWSELSSLKNQKKVNFEDKLANKIEFREKPKLEFEGGENVLYFSLVNGHAYSYRAKIVKKISNFVYLIELENKVQKTAHINQLRKSILKPFIDSHVKVEFKRRSTAPKFVIPRQKTTKTKRQHHTVPENELRKSSRQKKQPDRFQINHKLRIR